MESLSWVWHVGAGMIVGLSLTFGAWSAAALNDRTATMGDSRRNVDRFTRRAAHHTARSAPTPRE